MQHDAAHMGVVEIEQMAHLAVDQRRIAMRKPQSPAKHRGLRAAAH